MLQLVLVALAVWAGVYARIALGPLQEAMRTALCLSDNQVALLQGPAIALATVIGSLPIGFAVDRYSRNRLLLLFVVLCLIGSLITARTAHFGLLLGARALVGLAAIGSLIAAFSLVADLYTPAQRGRATILVGCGELGLPLAFAIGGALLSWHGAAREGWRWALLWMTVPPLIVTALLMFALREPPRTGLLRKNLPVWAALGELLRYRAIIVPLLAARALVGVADQATVIWGAPLLARRFHLQPDRVGAIMATVLLVASLSSAVVGGLVADYCQRTGGPRRTVRAMGALALLSIPACGFALASAVGTASLLMTLFVTLGYTVNIAGAALSTIVVPNEVRGTFFSVSMVVGAILGWAGAPLLVSTLSSGLGGPPFVGQALGTVCLLTSLLAVATFAWSSRFFPRQAPL